MLYLLGIVRVKFVLFEAFLEEFALNVAIFLVYVVQDEAIDVGAVVVAVVERVKVFLLVVVQELESDFGIFREKMDSQCPKYLVNSKPSHLYGFLLQ